MTTHLLRLLAWARREKINRTRLEILLLLHSRDITTLTTITKETGILTRELLHALIRLEDLELITRHRTRWRHGNTKAISLTPAARQLLNQLLNPTLTPCS